ncbi:MAG: RimJ/RimL family protein N-acetyltransferase [Gammaproteobacteria bacterium]|jgi:RimJ/RimL family protein N-acetyltransferase
MSDMQQHNEHDQPIGAPVGGWTPPGPPPRATIEGRWCRLEPLDVERHGADLFNAVSHDSSAQNWTYLSIGPFADETSYLEWLRSVSAGPDPIFYAFIDRASSSAVGVGAYMRISPENGCIEVGNLHFSPLMQRTAVATEAMFLMMKQVFELGYRRYEWKCDSHNGPSRLAAQRFGFSWEGIFRQAIVYKGRNRDTAWFAMVDTEWPALCAAYERWLAPGNFDDAGQQRESLSTLTRPVLARVDPDLA